MKEMYPVISIAIIAAVTALTRFLPFVVFGEKRKTPQIISKLGQLLPHAIMGMLVVYCLKGVTVTVFPHGIPELISVIAVVLLHLWKRNTLLSVGCGTILYMILVQNVFI